MAILQMTINVEETNNGHHFNCAHTEGNWIVDWGDDCIEVNKKYHTYKQAGLYQITVKGDFEIKHIKFPQSVISLDKEEGCEITSLENCFIFCIQLVLIPKNWDVSKVTDMESMFEGCVSFNQDLSHWNLEKVSTVYMFVNCPIEEKHKPKGLR